MQHIRKQYTKICCIYYFIGHLSLDIDLHRRCTWPTHFQSHPYIFINLQLICIAYKHISILSLNVFALVLIQLLRKIWVPFLEVPYLQGWSWKTRYAMYSFFNSRTRHSSIKKTIVHPTRYMPTVAKVLIFSTASINVRNNGMHSYFYYLFLSVSIMFLKFIYH